MKPFQSCFFNLVKCTEDFFTSRGLIVHFLLLMNNDPFLKHTKVCLSVDLLDDVLAVSKFEQL